MRNWAKSAPLLGSGAGKGSGDREEKFQPEGLPRLLELDLAAVTLCGLAHVGDAEAVERVLRYYSGYMNKLCTRTLYDENGYPHVCLDEAMKRRLKIKLIHAIVTTK